MSLASSSNTQKPVENAKLCIYQGLYTTELCSELQEIDNQSDFNIDLFISWLIYIDFGFWGPVMV